MTKEVFDLISSTFIMYYSNSSPLKSGADVYNMALSIIKIFNMKFSYDECTVYSLENDWKMTFENAKKLSFGTKIIPYKLKHIDIDSIETILNSPKYEGLSKKMSPLFECIGYILDYESSMTTMVFIGSPIYDMYPSYNTRPFEKVDWKQNLCHTDGTPINLSSIEWKDITK